MATQVNLVVFSDSTFLYTTDSVDTIAAISTAAAVKATTDTKTTTATKTTTTTTKTAAATMPAAIPYEIRTNVGTPKSGAALQSTATGTRSPMPADYPPPEFMYDGHWCDCGDGGWVFVPRNKPCPEVLHTAAYWEMLDRING